MSAGQVETMQHVGASEHDLQVVGFDMLNVAAHGAKSIELRKASSLPFNRRNLC
jgi:hypothetical protein